MVSAAAIPPIQTGIGAQLNHAVWQGRPGICMAMSACTYKRINILYKVFLSKENERENDEKRKKEQRFIFHADRFAQDKTL